MGNSISGWTVKAISNEPTGVASFPANEAQTRDTPYVLVTVAGRQASLRVVVRTGAAGKVIFVAPGTLRLNDAEDAACSWTPMTAKEHSNHQLFHTKGGRLAIVGLVLGLIGIGIDGSLKVGNGLPAIRITARTYAGLLIAASVLQAAGLFLVFAKAARRADF